MALKVKNAYVPWYEWDEDERDYNSAKKLYDTLPDIGFFTWLQYEFDRQWHSVLDFAHKKGILIIGDMPIYVAHDSADVWCDPKSFLLDDEYMPTTVAGCPPDAYSEDGQLWGNPIYDWERMRNDGFTWWLARIERAFKLYDILRIDHFRGFASYYSIPYGDENAKRGEWIEAPGLRLFRRVREVFPKARIIAEDLGLITDDVRDLLRRTEFPGMKLLQFAFFEDDNEYLPRTYKHSNSVVYTASHDSDCTRSWAKELDAETRARFLRECPAHEGESECAALVRLAMESRSNLCVIPMQDYLEQTNARGRINTPSVPYGNWTYRLSKSYATRELREKILKITDASGRRA